MEKKTRRPYGLWDSPISPHRMAQSSSFSNVAWNTDGTLVWTESRPERGNVIVVQPPDGQAPRDLNPDFSARGRVGYGGGDFTVGAGHVYFAEAASGRIYRQSLANGAPRPVTPAFGSAAGPALSPDGRWLLFVHTYEDVDVLAVVDAAGHSWPKKLAEGADFYMQPAWHPDGRRVAWIEWNHPNMPWDGTRLRVAELSFPSGRLPGTGEVITVAGDERTSIFQPEFSPDGRYLAYVSDASGWSQLYLYDLQTRQTRQLTSTPAEHGMPAWIQGMRRYAFGAGMLYFLRNQDATTSLWRLDLNSGQEQQLPLGNGYTFLDQICVWPGPDDWVHIALLASGARIPIRVITYRPDATEAEADCSEPGELRVARRSQAEDLAPQTYSLPEAVTWPGMDGQPVYGLYYPPHNENFQSDGLPPLVVHVHGGPTSQVFKTFNLQAQFFTSRGYGFLSVNHRGSTGYGRAYQDMLYGNWGIYDVQDSVSGARWLAEQGRIDGQRMAIMGGSAGGYTVLKALQDYPGTFRAALCLYGISNQFTAATDTHKFEISYNDLLMGPLPEAAEIYRQRSPIFFADRIQDPVAFFQGEEDVVVRRDQSDTMVAELKRRGVPHIYHVYPGEGHGFRKPANIEHFYKESEAFLRQWLIFS